MGALFGSMDDDNNSIDLTSQQTDEARVAAQQQAKIKDRNLKLQKEGLSLLKRRFNVPQIDQVGVPITPVSETTSQPSLLG